MGTNYWKSEILVDSRQRWRDREFRPHLWTALSEWRRVRRPGFSIRALSSWKRRIQIRQFEVPGDRTDDSAAFRTSSTDTTGSSRKSWPNPSKSPIPLNCCSNKQEFHFNGSVKTEEWIRTVSVCSAAFAPCPLWDPWDVGNISRRPSAGKVVGSRTPAAPGTAEYQNKDDFRVNLLHVGCWWP